MYYFIVLAGYVGLAKHVDKRYFLPFSLQDDRILTCCVYFCVFLPLPVCCHHSWELQRWQLSHDVSLLASGDNDGLDLETQRRNKIRTSVREALMLHVLRSLLVVLVTSSTDNTGALIRACLVLFFFDVCMQRTRSCTLTHACFFDRIEFFSIGLNFFRSD